MTGIVLDAGALIAFERGDRAVVTLIARAKERGDVLAVPAGVLAQVWRDGRKQVRLARLVASDSVEIEPLDEIRAKAAGLLLGIAGSSDVVDASVVLSARARKLAVATGDAAELLALDGRLRIVRV